MNGWVSIFVVKNFQFCSCDFQFLHGGGWVSASNYSFKNKFNFLFETFWVSNLVLISTIVFQSVVLIIDWSFVEVVMTFAVSSNMIRWQIFSVSNIDCWAVLCKMTEITEKGSKVLLKRPNETDFNWLLHRLESFICVCALGSHYHVDFPREFSYLAKFGWKIEMEIPSEKHL